MKKKSNKTIKDIEPEYLIDEKSDCFLDITVRKDLTKPLFFRATHELLSHRNYFERHTLWNLTNIQLRLSFGDLKEISYVLRNVIPKKKVYEKKLAVVASGEFNIFIVKFIMDLLSFLPFEFGIFNDYNAAKNFLEE